ncbi:MAG: hypothetical protein ACI35S_08505 [Anaeroplasma sp.]
MKLKKLFLGASVAVLGLSIASCKGDKEVRNTTTPYGSLHNQLDTVIATANNGNLQLTLDKYYSSLKYNSYSVFTNSIDKALFKDEYDALTEVFNKTNLTELTENAKNTLKVSDIDSNNKEILLYELNQEKYTEIRQDLYEAINSSLASTIFSTSSAEAINKKTSKEINTSIEKFIDEQAKKGISITKDDITWINKKDAGYFLSVESDLIQFSQNTLNKLSSNVESILLSEAKNYSARKALFKIADEEYILDEETEEETKNSNYLFKESSIKSTYEESYMTFGTYKAIIIQFNSRREADEAIQKIGNIPSNPADALNKYIELYNHYYEYKLDAPVTADNDIFMYTVNEEKDDFDELSSSISTLIKDTLEDGQYLTEPRNISNKYVLAYRINTQYDYHADNNASKQLEYDELSAVQKNEIDAKIKENLIIANASSYLTKNYSNILSNSDLKIYDPYFEYKFEYSYSDEYTAIEENVKPESNVLFSTKNGEYSVEQFYEDASKTSATSIITNYFQLEYAYQLYDEYVDDVLISSEKHEDSEKSLDTAIETFKKNNNSTYPAKIGLDNYLLAAYGYTTKEDVLKYYYDAKEALNVYKAKTVFEEWVQESIVDENVTYKLSDEAKNGFLKNLLETGNSTYNKLFSINLDHILINIDDNADGSPDDPADFLSKNPNVKAEFEAAVEKLAKAIYLEATYDAYKDNTLYETLTYIKTQYEEGGKLLSAPNKTWDDYKEFNFLLTVEQLASSGDITQDSVSNFVVPFKEYVENIYYTASANNIANEYEDGIFYFCYEKDGEIVGSTAHSASDVSLVTFDSLCATNYGYHMIVLNSYEGPESTQFTEKDDVSGFQSNLQIVIREYEKDDEDISIYVNIDSYNEEKTSASINQLFIYYVQKQNGADSSLDSDIVSIMSSLFDDVISTYTSSNFQNYLLVELLDIKVNKVTFNNFTLDNSFISAYLTSLKNTIINYDSASKYVSWFDGTYTWTRPDSK